MSSMNVRASFWVSKVGTIVSSSGAALGLDPGVGMSVCAYAIGDSTKSKNAIQRLRPCWRIRVRVIRVIPIGLSSRAKSRDLRNLPWVCSAGFFDFARNDEFRQDRGQINAFAKTGALPPPIFDQLHPWLQS